MFILRHLESLSVINSTFTSNATYCSGRNLVRVGDLDLASCIRGDKPLDLR